VVVIDHAASHRSEALADPLPSWKKPGWLMKYLRPYAPALHLSAILWRRITYTW